MDDKPKKRATPNRISQILYLLSKKLLFENRIGTPFIQIFCDLNSNSNQLMSIGKFKKFRHHFQLSVLNEDAGSPAPLNRVASSVSLQQYLTATGDLTIEEKT